MSQFKIVIVEDTEVTPFLHWNLLLNIKNITVYRSFIIYDPKKDEIQNYRKKKKEIDNIMIVYGKIIFYYFFSRECH